MIFTIESMSSIPIVIAVGDLSIIITFFYNIRLHAIRYNINEKQNGFFDFIIIYNMMYFCIIRFLLVNLQGYNMYLYYIIILYTARSRIVCRAAARVLEDG